jgi:hypothetical protein
MTLSVVGETPKTVPPRPLLMPDWHKKLQPTQLLAYLRHAYIWRSRGTVNIESSDHTKKVARWDGGEDSFGCKFTPVWPRIAKMIESCGAFPGIWVAAHFSPVAMRKYVKVGESFEVRDVSPTNLCSKLSEQIYNEYCDFLPPILEQNLETAGRTMDLRLRSLAKLNISKADQYACVVCDEGYVTASPFFRHAFATLFKAEDAVEKYLWAAAFEYEANQALYAHLPDWCQTAKLLNAVEVIRTHWRRLG